MKIIGDIFQGYGHYLRKNNERITIFYHSLYLMFSLC